MLFLSDPFDSALLDHLLLTSVIALKVAIFALSLRVKELVTVLTLIGFFGLAFRVVAVVTHVFGHLELIFMRAYPLGLNLESLLSQGI